MEIDRNKITYLIPNQYFSDENFCIFLECGKVKHKLRVTSSNLRVTSSNPWVVSSKPRVMSSNLRVMSWNSRVTSSNARVRESLNQWKLK